MKGLVIVALVVCAWLALLVELMLLVTWPWPTATATAWVSGLVAGGILAGERRRAGVEVVAERMDAYRLADTRTDLDTIGPVTGEHPQVEPSDGEAIEPAAWALDGAVEPGRYPARCDWCGRTATAFGEWGPQCAACDEWSPAQPGRQR